MLLITISPEIMVFHLPRAPPRSHLLSVPSFAVFACFWLVVVYEITDRQPSKASVYFIVVFDSKADKQGRRSFPRPIHRTLRGPRQLIVVWVIFRTRIDGPIRSAHPDSTRVTNPPRRPNFAKNMHPDKWCRPSESGHTRVPRRRSWCCSGVAAAVVRYCTHSLCRRHGRMVLWCTIHCVNCECSLFLLVLCGCALSK